MRMLNLPPRLKSRSGITMMELMIVVVIIGLVASMAVPRFQRAMEKIKYRSADRDLTSTLRLARSLSVSEKRNYGVFFKNNYAGGTYSPGSLYYVLFLDSANPGAGTYENGDSLIRIDSLPYEFSMLTTDITNDCIIFEPNGSASFTGGGNIITMATNSDLVGIHNHNILASTGRVKSNSYYY